MEPEKEITRQQALERLMLLCSKAERCSGDALRLLRRWRIPQEEHDGIIEKLRQDRYLDDARYVRAFVRDKLRYSGWGERKIADALAQKRLGRELIREVIAEESDPERMQEKTARALEQKAGNIRYKNRYDLKNKLMRFGLSRGYAYEAVERIAEKIVRRMPEEEE